jgi:anti-anti-sigma regulatory factor
MSVIAVILKVEPQSLDDALYEACAHMQNTGHDTVLDFSYVQRLDPKNLEMMQKLASIAEDKELNVGLRGVNVDIYKVLKLARLAERFCFLN